MEVEALCSHLSAMKGATCGHPFGPCPLVFKVMGKMFALVNDAEPPLSVNLKCDPERAIELREEYEDIRPGWHMNKVIWE